MSPTPNPLASKEGVALLGPVAWSPCAPPLVGRAAALLAWLALRDGRSVSRDETAEALWPDRPVESARHSLRQALVGLRKGAAEAGRLCDLEIEGDRLRLAPTPPTDWATVRQLLNAANREETRVDALRAALARFRGEPLAGLADAWAESMRSSAYALERQILSLLATELLATAPADSLALADRGLQRDAFDDDFQELRQRALERLGQGRQAERARDTYRARLREEMGLEVADPLTPVPSAAPLSCFDELFAATPRETERVRLVLAAAPYFRVTGRATEGLARLRGLGAPGEMALERRVVEAELEAARGAFQEASGILDALSAERLPYRLKLRTCFIRARVGSTVWDLNNARRAALQGMRIAISGEDRMECWRTLAMVHERRRDPTRALRAANQARRLALYLRDDDALSFAEEIRAYAAWYAGDVATARDAAREARTLAQSGRAGRRGPYSMVRLARLAEEWDGIDEATEGYEEGLGRLQCENEPERLRAALVMAGDFATTQGRYDEARCLLRRAVGLYRDVGETMGLSTALRGLGLAYEAQGNHAVSRAHLRESASWLRAGTSPMATTLIPLARLELEKRPERALRMARTALGILRMTPEVEVAALVVKGRRLYGEAEDVIARAELGSGS